MNKEELIKEPSTIKIKEVLNKNKNSSYISVFKGVEKWICKIEKLIL